MINLGRAGDQIIGVSREIRFEWRAGLLATTGAASIRYRRCREEPPIYRNGAVVQLLAPHFHLVYLAPAGLADLPAFQAALAVLTSAQFYYLLSVTDLIHCGASASEKIPVTVDDKRGLLELTTSRPEESFQGWVARLTLNDKLLGDRRGWQFESSRDGWLESKYVALAKPFELNEQGPVRRPVDV